jgi:hypothetical protein
VCDGKLLYRLPTTGRTERRRETFVDSDTRPARREIQRARSRPKRGRAYDDTPGVLGPPQLREILLTPRNTHPLLVREDGGGLLVWSPGGRHRDTSRRTRARLARRESVSLRRNVLFPLPSFRTTPVCVARDRQSLASPPFVNERESGGAVSRVPRASVQRSLVRPSHYVIHARVRAALRARARHASVERDAEPRARANGASSVLLLKRPSARRGPGIVSVDRNVRSKCRCSCVLQFTS